MAMATVVRRRLAAPWRHLDLALLFATITLMTVGAAMVYSSTAKRLERVGMSSHYFFSRQMVWIVAGLIVLFLVATFDYRSFKGYGPVMYAGFIASLVAVLVFGGFTRGARGWFDFGFFQLQPAELGKPIFIILIASVLNEYRGEVGKPELMRTLAFSAAPIFLILIQPDLGESLAYTFILLGMLLVAGVKPRHFAALALVGVFAAVLAFNSPILKDYQKQRITAFATQDAAGTQSNSAAYNLSQSKIAIGSGGWTGRGYGKGSQTALAFVPEQHTDFIFAAVGEELGFIGGTAVILLFGLIVWRGMRIAGLSRDLFGTLIAAGVTSIFVFQVFENIGMTMGIMPITGLPLPLLSYGGSPMISTGACIGLLMNIHMHRFQ